MDKTQADRELRLLAAGREKMLAGFYAAEQKGGTNRLPYMQLLHRRFLLPLAKAIDDRLASKVASRGGKFTIYLGKLDSKIVALRTLQSLISGVVAEGAAESPLPIARKLSQEVGKAVYQEYLMQNFKALSPPLFNSIMREFDKRMTKDEAHIVSVFRKRYRSEGYEFPLWGFGDVQMVGHYLIGECATLGLVDRWTGMSTKKGRPYTNTYLMLNPDVRGMCLQVIDYLGATPRAATPMIEPPLDWDASTNSGGGFHTQDMQRLLACAVQGYGERPVSEYTVNAINIAQRTARCINERVLDVVRQASLRWDFGDIVGATTPLPKPEWRDDFTADEKRDYNTAAKAYYTDKKVRAVHHRKAQAIFVAAEELRQYPAIWFAYYADTRGRIYARSSPLNPQGNDLEKGLLMRRDGALIDNQVAADWFCIHGANTYGKDKLPLAGRVAWVAENHEFLLAIAADPLANRGWMDADAPVQFLAWCFEYADWQRVGPGFRSHLTVALDGTCSGLQHYSALLRDEVGGVSVNLTPPRDPVREGPQDVYMDVAKAVLPRLDAMPPSPIKEAWQRHGVGRKVTKRSCMTLPYGSTRYACGEFICGDYLEVVKPPEFSMGDYGAAAKFMANLVWDAIGRVVVKSTEGMQWLRGWAKHAVETGAPVQWTTPTGLLVRSEQRKAKKKRVNSVAFKCSAMLLQYSDEVGLRETCNAVAPNFIHSLDASHLCMVVTECAKVGIELDIIHDSFGAPPARTAELAEIIRRTFVDLYRDIDPLREMQQATGYPIDPPTRGKLALERVLDSPYFFS